MYAMDDDSPAMTEAVVIGTGFGPTGSRMSAATGDPRRLRLDLLITLGSGVLGLLAFRMGWVHAYGPAVADFLLKALRRNVGLNNSARRAC